MNTLVKVILYDEFGDKIEVLYSMINDMNLFCKILECFGGMSIAIPSKDKFIELITLVMVYYYHEILMYDWKKIEGLIPYERDIGLRYASKIKKLKQSIKNKINKKYKEEKEDIFS